MLVNFIPQIDICFERPTDHTPYHNTFITLKLTFSFFTKDMLMHNQSGLSELVPLNQRTGIITWTSI